MIKFSFEIYGFIKNLVILLIISTKAIDNTLGFNNNNNNNDTV